ncbi:nucleoside-diphosphate sugar epimerase [Galbibacter pacificus]|uniref:Nucleoside-diphosphate sugar epimerase n=1 Tax=Galbibacter pacificus TaxID=2996052 RepID=A0ABT6FTC8_9FLAO|nr:nucleoside-diphosphate sugar epimerase [Galbibacter pacificus]MDG3583042.1 nucleoside-diphosphate sugar epimerase [Galbibacter pacificus]MDG3586523.1 nucleoside-diphosphate sugar epimerase [Galbibacter pacificus]
MEEGKTAIILGATGLTGSILLTKLLKDKRYNKIKLFSRNHTNIEHPKIEEHLVDLFNLKLHENDFTANEVYCCIGTTRAKTPKKSTYKAIDYGIPVSAAMLCEKNNIHTFAVISALGAKTKSKFFYNRVKGLMEREVLLKNIEKIIILQPSLISGKREEKRTGEWLFKQLMKGLNYLMTGPLKKYQPVSPEKIAETMIFLANTDGKTRRIPNEQIHEIANNL